MEDKEKMKKITLRNSFHGTEIEILAPDYCEGSLDAWAWAQEEVYRDQTNAAKQRLRKIERTLCGCEGCQCGGVR